MTKKASEKTPEELEAYRKYQRDWARNKKLGKKTTKKEPAVLKIAPLYNGDDPGEALFYISDSLQVMNGYLKRIVEACEKAGGL